MIVERKTAIDLMNKQISEEIIEEQWRRWQRYKKKLCSRCLIIERKDAIDFDECIDK